MKRIHPIAGFVGFLTILCFWMSTLVVELFGNAAAILAVKTGILWGMIVLVPSLAITGATGFRLAGPVRTGLVRAKQRRMPVIAANGLLILVPCAFVLQRLAAESQFTPMFYALQALELLAGAVNLTLIGLNIRDGLRMTRRRRAMRVGGGTDGPGAAV
ncbi:hypothetical protein HAD_07090 [Hyphomonas adhaerens MHS-3]|uniref:Uncharacterized protein n=1 Tax=Hyphomonas adhaerens MHS-3 TaxID=1280949 RepID=A0A069E614_9PROT|nr:hypothetical protein [Hyphomonas adhaerens]KCZ85429.1 hypothetical protein HAD_07090 [Hyphomonas adhaerens MHS-3]